MAIAWAFKQSVKIGFYFHLCKHIDFLHFSNGLNGLPTFETLCPLC